MSGNIALDTSVAVALLRGDQRVAQFVARSSVFISTIAVGELCFGAEKSHRPSIGYRHIEQLEAICPVMNCDAETSRYFAQVKIRLRRLGQMIPENDIWIAAHALQYSAKLATFDAHFSVVEGLQTESF